MSDFTYRKPSAKNIEAVTLYLPLFEKGTEVDSYATRGGAVDYTDAVHQFVNKLYQEGFVYGFDWGSWLNKVGEEYVRNKDNIRSADILTIQRMLTAIVRADRFNDGLLMTMIDDGIIVAILRRLEEIRKQMLQND